MNIHLSTEAHIAIRYAILHAFDGNINPETEDYTIQRAATCAVCSSEGTPFGIECTQMRQLAPGDRLFHHVCSHCFSQIITCTDFVTFNVLNIGYFNTTTGRMEYHCTESQYKDATEYHIEGRECDYEAFRTYLGMLRETALSNRQRSIKDSEKYFTLDSASSGTTNLPFN